MKTETVAKLISLALQTRSYGYCYVPAAIRQSTFGWKGETYKNIKLTYRGYGRSLQGGGHKYKVHARYIDTDSPVPTKVLKTV